MAAGELSGRVGAGLDPCGAIRVPFELLDGQAREIIFRLGAGLHADDALKLAQRLRGSCHRAARRWKRLGIIGSARLALSRWKHPILP